MIINQLAENISNKTFFKNLDEVEKTMFSSLNIFKKNDSQIKHTFLKDIKFENHNIILDNIDYYYSNVIARASKTMFECRNEKIKLQLTETQN